MNFWKWLWVKLRRGLDDSGWYDYSDPFVPYQAIDHSLPVPLESPLQQGSTWSYTVLANSAAVGPTGVTGPTGPTGWSVDTYPKDVANKAYVDNQKTETEEISEPTLVLDQLSADPRKRKFYFE